VAPVVEANDVHLGGEPNQGSGPGGKAGQRLPRRLLLDQKTTAQPDRHGARPVPRRRHGVQAHAQIR
jgi:hypothetical protein